MPATRYHNNGTGISVNILFTHILRIKLYHKQAFFTRATGAINDIDICIWMEKRKQVEIPLFVIPVQVEI